MADYDNLQITAAMAEQIVHGHYGIKWPGLCKLPGEIDFNFRIKVKNQDGFILKISRPEENGDYLDFQQKLLQYVAQNRMKLLTAPQVVNDLRRKYRFRDFPIPSGDY